MSRLRLASLFLSCLCCLTGDIVSTEDPESFCNSMSVLGLVIQSPLERSFLLKGHVHFQFLTSAPRSDKLKYFIFVDDDPVVAPGSDGLDETVEFVGNESIGIDVDDVGEHVFSLVQTCSPSAWQEEGDEIDVQRVFVSFTTLEATKTGRKVDGAAGAEDPNWKYALSAVAVFRNEELYIQEWIEFHRCAGIEHFYLFNHHSTTDEHLSILAPYVQSGIVDLDNATDSVLEDGEVKYHAQLLTFSKAVETYKNETKWMAFIDIDEFLFAVGPVTIVGSDGSTMEVPTPTLLDVLPAYQEFGGVVVHWVMYGSSGHEETPRGLVIENYLWRAEEVSPLFKSIAKPSRLVKCNNHNHEFQDNFFAVNEDNDIIPHNTSQNHPGTARVFRINHYRSKSRAHLSLRIRRSLEHDSFHRDDDDGTFNRSSPHAQHLQQRWEEEEAGQNQVQDRAALPFVTCIKDGLLLRGMRDWNAFVEFANAADGEGFEHADPAEQILLTAWVFGPAETKYSAAIAVNASQVGTIDFDPLPPNQRWAAASLLLPLLSPGRHSISARLVGPPSGRYSSVAASTVEISVQVGLEGSGSAQSDSERKLTQPVERKASQSRKTEQNIESIKEQNAQSITSFGSDRNQGDSCAEDSVCSQRRVGELERMLGMSEEQSTQAVTDLKRLLEASNMGEAQQRPISLGANSVSPLQEMYIRLHGLLHQGGMLPIGLKDSTPHDGVTDVWGVERGGAPVRVLIDRFLDRVQPVLPEAARCLEWGRHYSQGALSEVCNCGVGPGGWCSTSWSIEFGDCDEGWYPSKQTVCADVARLSQVMPTNDVGFDVIVCTQVLEHLPDPPVALREMWRALAPGGQLILTVPFMEQYHQARGQFRDYWRWTHVGARQMVEAAGFRVDRLETAGSSLTATAAMLGFGTDDLHVAPNPLLKAGEMLEGSVGDYSATSDEDWGVHAAQYQGVHVLASRPDADSEQATNKV